MIDVANIALRAAALGAAALCLVWSYAEAGRFGGPGIGGGLSHMGAAMSIHAPGGGEFRAGLSMPLLRDRAIDRPRASVRQANLDVQIAEPTYRLVAPLFDMEVVDALEVKGVAGPMRAYRVRGRRVEPGSLRGIAGLASPLVGGRGEA